MTFQVDFKETTSQFDVTFESQDLTYDVEIDAYYSKNKDFYIGNYEVTPKAEEQVLNTKDKIMVDDVTVKKVPYYETENDEGGLTVYIASEV